MSFSQGTLGFDLLVVGLWGLLFLFGFFVVARGIELLPLGQDRRAFLRRSVPALAFLGSLVFFLFAANTIFSRYPEVLPLSYLTVFAIYGLLTWTLFRDALAGAALRSEGLCEVGDHVSIGERSGRIVEMGLRALMVESPEGDVIAIPYSQAAQESVVLNRAVDKGATHTFVVDLPEGRDFADAAQRIRRAALCCHWSSIVKQPEVRRVTPGQAEVSVFALDVDHLPEIEDAVHAGLARE